MTGVITVVKDDLCQRLQWERVTARKHYGDGGKGWNDNGELWREHSAAVVTMNHTALNFPCAVLLFATADVWLRMEIHLTDVLNETENVLISNLNKHHRTFLSFLMILFKRIASLMHPSALLCLAWGRDQVGEVNMNLINPWSNPSLERCTWSLSEHCLAACCIPTSIARGAFSMFCCQTQACHLCRMCESQAQGRSLEDRESTFPFLQGHGHVQLPLYPDVQAGCKDTRGEQPSTPQGASAGAACLCCSPVLGCADRCTGACRELCGTDHHN